MCVCGMDVFRIHLSPPPQLDNPIIGFFLGWFWGSELRSSCLHNKHFTHWSMIYIFQSLPCILRTNGQQEGKTKGCKREGVSREDNNCEDQVQGAEGF